MPRPRGAGGRAGGGGGLVGGVRSAAVLQAPPGERAAREGRPGRGPGGGGLDKDAPGNAAGLSPAPGSGRRSGRAARQASSLPTAGAGCSSAARAAGRKGPPLHPPLPGKSPLCVAGGPD